MTIDRRTFLGGSAALALGGGAALDVLGPAGEALAASGGPLPIGGTDHLLVGPHALDYRSGFQSFAWSPVSKAFIYAQPAPAAGHSGIIQAKHYGDLLVSTISSKGRTTSSHMQLNGFGHGGSMGIEISPGRYNYVWLDTSAHVGSGDADPRAICCFRYTGKGTYTPRDLGTSTMPHSQRYVLQPGSTHQAVSFDQSTRRIALRYQVSSGFHYAIYDVAALRRTGGRAKPLYDAIPAGAVEAGGTGSFQSFALWGDWLYALRGTKSKDNATLHAYNVRTRRATRAATHAAPAKRGGREPEGLCVYTGGSTPRLAFGIKNDAKSPSKSQTTAIYYK